MCCVESKLDLCRKVFFLNVVNAICTEEDKEVEAEQQKCWGVLCQNNVAYKLARNKSKKSLKSIGENNKANHFKYGRLVHNLLYHN